MYRDIFLLPHSHSDTSILASLYINFNCILNSTCNTSEVKAHSIFDPTGGQNN